MPFNCLDSSHRAAEESLMSVIIGHFEFEGPLASMAEVPSAPGLYAVLHKEEAHYYLLDFALSENLARTAPNVLEFDDASKLVVLRCNSKRKRIEIFEDILEDVHSKDEMPSDEEGKENEITCQEIESADSPQEETDEIPQVVHHDYLNKAA